jgi:hypothetical protein
MRLGKRAEVLIKVAKHSRVICERSTRLLATVFNAHVALIELCTNCITLLFPDKCQIQPLSGEIGLGTEYRPDRFYPFENSLYTKSRANKTGNFD